MIRQSLYVKLCLLLLYADRGWAGSGEYIQWNSSKDSLLATVVFINIYIFFPLSFCYYAINNIVGLVWVFYFILYYSLPYLKCEY